jgi:outer membrane protein OmpA-like peptidoglycan-associated protein
MPVRGLERADRNTPTAWQEDFAGKVTSIGYAGPADRSALEIMRNHEQALQGNGFTVRFFCKGEEECSPGRMIPTFWEAARGAVRMPNQWGASTYLLAENDGPEGRLTVAIYAIELKATGNRPLMPHVAVTVVEGKPMETGKIALVAASEMEQALARDGRIAIYGIYFDFDKAELKAESQPQIDQLATLLKDNPGLSVLVVGHTDGQGGFDYNLKLSQLRAQAVTDALIANHGVAASRVTPAGAGMVAPVATNRTEEGRSKNRRVEIVELLGGG